MNARTEILAGDKVTFDHAAYHGFRPDPGATRHQGWTPDKQRTFLEALSEGQTVVHACAIVGLSKQSAYALRHSPRGHGFALGWDAAVLVSRSALADELMERAFHGTRETVTDDEGRLVTRHRYDNRVALAMLGRLDRMADAQAGCGGAAARLIAMDFAQYLELVGRDAGPARAGVFLHARIAAAGEEELAPIRALARADAWLRTRTDLAEPLDTADLDPDARADWTAEQWKRAEAAGLIALAPAAPETCESSQASQPDGQPADPFGGPVWWDDVEEQWRTRYPPAEDFHGAEEGDYGDPGYCRELSVEEEAVVEAARAQEIAELRAEESAERDAFFASLLEPDPGADRGAEGDRPRQAKSRRRGARSLAVDRDGAGSQRA